MTYETRSSRSFRFAALVAIAALCLGACTQIPELDEAVPNWVRRADYPELTALDPSVTTIVLPQDSSDDIEREMTARQATLERKAKWLKSLDLDEAAQPGITDEITE